MKTKKFKGKLSLNKEVISKLQNNQMAKIMGGSDRLCEESKYGKCTIIPEPDTKVPSPESMLTPCCTEANCSYACC